MAKPRDPVQIAKSIYDQFLTKNDPDSVPSEPQPNTPNPKAQAAGRKGGLKGGKARAAALTPRKREADREEGREGPLEFLTVRDRSPSYGT